MFTVGGDQTSRLSDSPACCSGLAVALRSVGGRVTTSAISWRLPASFCNVGTANGPVPSMMSRMIFREPPLRSGGVRVRGADLPSCLRRAARAYRACFGMRARILPAGRERLVRLAGPKRSMNSDAVEVVGLVLHDPAP